MDFKDPKFQKIALACMVFFVLVYFWYARVYSQQARQIDGKRQQYQEVITNLRNVEMKSKSLEALKAEYQSLLAKYRDIEELLPEVKMVPSFLVQLNTASSLTGAKITAINPKPIAPESFYNVANFEVELTGGYHQFGRFISYIANFPFIVNVSDMKMETFIDAGAADAKKRDGDKTTLKAKFTLSTYYVKADERLKELEI